LLWPAASHLPFLLFLLVQNQLKKALKSLNVQLKKLQTRLKKQPVPLKKQHAPLVVLLKKQDVPLLMRLAQLPKKSPSKLSLFSIEKCTGKAV
jgi:hypothetical protein